MAGPIPAITHLGGGDLALVFIVAAIALGANRFRLLVLLEPGHGETGRNEVS